MDPPFGLGPWTTYMHPWNGSIPPPPPPPPPPPYFSYPQKLKSRYKIIGKALMQFGEYILICSPNLKL